MPLRYLYANSRRYQACRRSHGSNDMSTVIANQGAAGSLSRREFLVRLQAVGGLLLIADGGSIVNAADTPMYGAVGMPNGTVDSPLVFVKIGEDGIVTLLGT